jgi:hypothetical protein
MLISGTGLAKRGHIKNKKKKSVTSKQEEKTAFNKKSLIGRIPQ